VCVCVCVCVSTVDKVFVGYPAVIIERRSNVARVFALRKYDYQIVCACRRLRFHIHCFFYIYIYIRPDVVSVRITFLYFRDDLYACRRISLDRPMELFLQATKTKGRRSTTIESRSAALRIATYSYNIYSYNAKYLYVIRAYTS
jgi:hypothetical protein